MEGYDKELLVKRIFNIIIPNEDCKLGSSCEFIHLDGTGYLFVYYEKEKRKVCFVSLSNSGEAIDQPVVMCAIDDDSFGTYTFLFYTDDGGKYFLILGKRNFLKYCFRSKRIITTVNNTLHQKNAEKAILFGKDLFMTCSTDEKVNMYYRDNLQVYRSFNFGDEAHCLTSSRKYPQYIISGGFGLKTNSRIRVWNHETQLRILGNKFCKAHTNGIKGINTVVLQGGTDEYIISMSWDQHIFFWNLETGELVYRISDGHSNIVEGGLVALSQKFLFSLAGQELLISHLCSSKTYSPTRRNSFQVVKKFKKTHSDAEVHVGYFISWMRFFSHNRNSRKIFITHRGGCCASVWDVVAEMKDVEEENYEQIDLMERIDFVQNSLCNEEDHKVLQQFRISLISRNLEFVFCQSFF